MATKKEQDEKANIAFVGKEKPLVTISFSGKVLELPADQSKPFYHSDAHAIVRHFPHLYKSVVEKGVK